MKRSGLLAPVGALAASVYVGLIRPWHLRWGATPAERSRSLPGDDVILNAIQTTRAITIDAPPSAVWPWLVQMGQDRAGFYSHDLLERLAGADIHNAEQIVPEWQTLAVGDLVRTYRPIERFEPLGWWVTVLETDRALVLRSNANTWSWALVLEPIDGDHTRLISRERKIVPWWGRPLDLFVGEPAHAVMDTGFLHGIKRRVERATRAPSSAPARTIRIAPA